MLIQRSRPFARSRFRIVMLDSAALISAVLTPFGRNCRIGANAVLVRSVHDHSVVVGVPGQVIAHGTSAEPDTRPKTDSPTAPDPVGLAVSSLLDRVQTLESHVMGAEHHSHSPVRLFRGEWELEVDAVDFVI